MLNLFIVIMFVFFYAISFYGNEIMNTISGIQDLFGDCRLSCIRTHAVTNYELGGPSDRDGTSTKPPSRPPAPKCVCTSCPCEYIDDVIQQISVNTRTRTQMLNSQYEFVQHVLNIIIERMLFIIDNVIISLTEEPENVNRRRELEAAFIQANRFDSSENIVLKEKSLVKIQMAISLPTVDKETEKRELEASKETTSSTHPSNLAGPSPKSPSPSQINNSPSTENPGSSSK